MDGGEWPLGGPARHRSGLCKCTTRARRARPGPCHVPLLLLLLALALAATAAAASQSRPATHLGRMLCCMRSTALSAASSSDSILGRSYDTTWAENSELTCARRGTDSAHITIAYTVRYA